MRFLFVALLALLPLRLGISAEPDSAGDAEKVDPLLYEVASGGEWETTDEHGDYRVLIFNGGYEHVSSQVYLQWLTHSPEGAHVVRSVLIAELSSGAWSVGIAAPFFGKPPTIRLHASRTYESKNARFSLKPGALGEYVLREFSSRKAK